MNRREIFDAVRDNLRDFSGTIIRESSIQRFLNEGLDRIMQVIPELQDMDYLNANNDEPEYLPKRYHQLLVFYTTGRCFELDENMNQASQYLNEFEVKLEELRFSVDAGDVVLGECGQMVNRRNEYVRTVSNREHVMIRNNPSIHEE